MSVTLRLIRRDHIPVRMTNDKTSGVCEERGKIRKYLFLLKAVDIMFSM